MEDNNDRGPTKTMPSKAEDGAISGTNESTLNPPHIRFPSESYSHGTPWDEQDMPHPPQQNNFLQLNREVFKRNAELSRKIQGSPPETDNTNMMMHDLHVKTDLQHLRRRSSVGSSDYEPRIISSASAASLAQRIPSIRSWLHSTAGSVSPGSVISSPQIAAMLDITPLPSPTMAPLESWKALVRSRSSRSRASSASSRADLPPLMVSKDSALSPTSPRRKNYSGLQSHWTRSSEDKDTDDESAQVRNRSISDYVPDNVLTPKPRQHAVSSAGPPGDLDRTPTQMNREAYVGAHRGIKPSVSQSETSVTSDESHQESHEQDSVASRSKGETYNAKSVSKSHPRAYESIKLLGQGTFSKVYLAVRLTVDRKESVDYRKESTNLAGVRARSRRLVAVKVIEPGPAGGADADRIETSLKREIELMKIVQHPCIVHLKAVGTDRRSRALLVMNYCPGGDLFDLASNRNDILTPSLIRRIFSELVSAVRYVHQKFIVHRDIKLENVLLNIPVQVHDDVSDWLKLDRAVITLTDLGLSRTIPAPPESPLLETRCGSEDYAAPEILMGQPYDGRQTDAWALGVLLYALMEGRLPFDALPGTRGDPAVLKARTPHRIARCEWGWVRYGDEDNEWDPEKGKDLEGARKCVEALLKRNTRRAALADIREWPWVRDGIQIDGGLRWVEEENL